MDLSSADRLTITKYTSAIPRPIFRYTSKKFAEDLLQKGEVYLSPLVKFIEDETLDVARRDEREGIATYSHKITGDSPLSDYQKTWFEEVGLNRQEGVDYYFNNISISHNKMLVYCVSHCFSSKIAQGFGADACVAIWEPTDFAGMIGKKLLGKHELGAVGRVIYNDKPFDYSRTGSLPPMLVKSEFFSWQKEVRFLFNYPKNYNGKKGIKLRIPKIREICSEMKL